MVRSVIKSINLYLHNSGDFCEMPKQRNKGKKVLVDCCIEGVAEMIPQVQIYDVKSYMCSIYTITVVKIWGQEPSASALVVVKAVFFKAGFLLTAVVIAVSSHEYIFISSARGRNGISKTNLQRPTVQHY